MTDLAELAPRLLLPPSVHRFRSGIGDAVNGYLVELDESVIAVDSCLGVAAGQRLRETLDGLGKPLTAVLVTHGHFDHVSGLAPLTAGTDARIVSTQGVADRLQTEYATAHQRFGAQLGDDWQPSLPPIDTVLGDGDQLELGSATVQVLDLGVGGDSAAGAAFGLSALEHWWFAGDLVYHDAHPLQLDGGVLAWLANLERVRRRLPPETRLLIGHGDPGGLELLDAQRDYLIDYAAQALDLCEPDGTFSASAKDELVRRITAARPGWALEMFVGLSAESVARELLGPSLGT